MIRKAVPTDEELIAAVRKGHQEAFRSIVERYQRKVATVTINMLGRGMEAEDAGQEVFIRFYRSIDQFKGESSLGTYLTRIAINLSLNALKKRQREHQLFVATKEGEPMDMADPNASHDLETKELVNKALEQLEPDFRSVVVLRMIEGYTTKETAEMLNLPLGTVLSRLSRAQQKLKSILTPVIKGKVD